MRSLIFLTAPADLHTVSVFVYRVGFTILPSIGTRLNRFAHWETGKRKLNETGNNGSCLTSATVTGILYRHAADTFGTRIQADAFLVTIASAAPTATATATARPVGAGGFWRERGVNAEGH
jgi:hypothetical protein